MSRPNSLSLQQQVLKQKPQFKEHRFDTAQVAKTKTQIRFYIYMLEL